MRFVSDDRKVDPTSHVTMEVIATGLPRCATSSIKEAFENYLDLGPSMHMANILPHPERMKALMDVMKETDFKKRQAMLSPLMSGYRASSDFPGSFFVPELLEIYPNIKIVLNTRKSASAWLESVKTSVAFFQTKPYYFMTYLIPSNYWHYHGVVAADKFWQRRYNVDTWISIESYEKHDALIRKLAKEKNVPLLEWEPSMGWAPLCKFLGKPVPDAPFPHVNESAFMRKLTIFFCIRGILAWALAFSAPAVLVYAIWRMRG